VKIKGVSAWKTGKHPDSEKAVKEKTKDRIVMSGNMNDHNYDADIYSNGCEAQALIAIINSLPGVRNDRVESVRQCIESGTYRIRCRKIAGRILEEEFPAVDEEISKPGISPLWTGHTACFPKRFSELHLPAIFRKGAGDRGAMTDASSEARKKQMLCHAKFEVIKSIRKAK
jgi:anti-sigma28 factor (negative regulator of flagellin synthesis)